MKILNSKLKNFNKKLDDLLLKRKTKVDLQVDKKTQILDISRAQKFGFTASSVEQTLKKYLSD